MAARVSVVLPIYNVAPYLETCLTSLAAQTLKDIEIVMVDDGSTDDGPSLAEAFAEKDARFRLVRQANAGLGAARNTGVRHASGEFLVFADSDDAVPPHAYQLMVGTLNETGSDFVTGKTMRFTASGSPLTPFQGGVFDRTRLRTHISRFPPLLVDRTAWNKLFRRSFWDRHGFRFPVGVYYEDTPVMLPAHYVARSVDVLEEAVYLWRLREGSDLSITQKRTELKSLRDRVAAVDGVSRFLADRKMYLSKALYDRTVLRLDLRFFLTVLPSVGEEYRNLFLELVNDFLDRAHPTTLEQPLAIDRLKWQLVRRRALAELLEVLHFEASELSERAPIRRRRHWYGDYPYRGDAQLALPDKVYRLEDELAPIARVEELRWEGETLRLSGYGYINLVGAPEPGSQRVQIAAVKRGFPPKRVPLVVEEVHRPDLTAALVQELTSLDYAGFVATLDSSKLRRGGDWQPASWDLRAEIAAEGLVKRTNRLDTAPLCPVPPVELAPAKDVRIRSVVERGELQIRIRREATVAPTLVFDDGVLELEGELPAATSGSLSLEIVSGGELPRFYPAHLDRSRSHPTFLARVPANELAGGPSLKLVNGVRRIPIALPQGTVGVAGSAGSAPVVTNAEFTPSGTLRLSGRLGSERSGDQLVLSALGMPQRFSLPLALGEEDGSFAVELTPGAMESLGGPRPLRQGTYELVLAPDGAGKKTVPLRVDAGLQLRLPLSASAGRKRFHLGVWDQGPLALAVEADHDEDERGGLAQRRLRTSEYPRARTGTLRAAVLYETFGGREFGDSPRAVYEELVRRGAPLEHLWVVDDEAFAVPEGASAIRKGSAEYFDAYARSRYLVSNDHWPRWFRRRDGQVAVQTWHGAPLKFQGRELVQRPFAFREHRRALGMGEGWDKVVSPGGFATPILERGYPIAGMVLETGLPRTDLLLGDRASARREELRRELGLADERVVLYAPTYRDDLDYGIGQRPRAPRDDRTYRSDLTYLGGYRLFQPLDLGELASRLGDGHTLLFYRHPRVADATPAAVAGAARDVSSFPDSLELLLVADILVTDYSSWLFDFAVTGRPVVVHAPDLERYRDEVRGLHVDLETEGPGPVARTLDEVVAAVADSGAWEDRRVAFVRRYCPLADGRASRRLVERVFEW